jgi:hypothetical protein
VVHANVQVPLQVTLTQPPVQTWFPVDGREGLATISEGVDWGSLHQAHRHMRELRGEGGKDATGTRVMQSGPVDSSSSSSSSSSSGSSSGDDGSSAVLSDSDSTGTDILLPSDDELTPPNTFEVFTDELRPGHSTAPRMTAACQICGQVGGKHGGHPRDHGGKRLCRDCCHPREVARRRTAAKARLAHNVELRRQRGTRSTSQPAQRAGMATRSSGRVETSTGDGWISDSGAQMHDLPAWQASQFRPTARMSLLLEPSTATSSLRSAGKRGPESAD